MDIILKNGRTGKIVNNVSVLFNNYDGYTYTVPINDIGGVYISEDNKFRNLSKIDNYKINKNSLYNEFNITKGSRNNCNIINQFIFYVRFILNRVTNLNLLEIYQNELMIIICEEVEKRKEEIKKKMNINKCY